MQLLEGNDKLLQYYTLQVMFDRSFDYRGGAGLEQGYFGGGGVEDEVEDDDDDAAHGAEVVPIDPEILTRIIQKTATYDALRVANNKLLDEIGQTAYNKLSQPQLLARAFMLAETSLAKLDRGELASGKAASEAEASERRGGKSERVACEARRGNP